MKKIEIKGKRYYYNDGNITPSVTTVISSQMPDNYIKMKMIGELGVKGWYDFLREKANYGTMLHIVLEIFVNQGYQISFNQIVGITQDFIQYECNTSERINELTKDVIRFAKFFKDYNVNVIQSEIVLSNEKFGGAIDYIVEMDLEEQGYFGEVYKSGERKGEQKISKQIRRIRAIIDLKSGSAKLDNYDYQLNAYADLANEYGYDIEKVFLLYKPDKQYDNNNNYKLTEIPLSEPNLKYFYNLLENFNIDNDVENMTIKHYKNLQNITIDTQLNEFESEMTLLSYFETEV
jgi:hypothetical protein